MYYVNCYTFFEQPERDWLKIIEMDNPQPSEPTLFDYMAYFSKKIRNTCVSALRKIIRENLSFSGLYFDNLEFILLPLYVCHEETIF